MLHSYYRLNLLCITSVARSEQNARHKKRPTIMWAYINIGYRELIYDYLITIFSLNCLYPMLQQLLLQL